VRARAGLPLDLPRLPKRVMMHVVDAGNFPSEESAVRLQCRSCGHETGWIPGRSVSADRRGRPCPECTDHGSFATTLPRITTAAGSSRGRRE